MSTQAYYKDRLGFDPRETAHDGPPEKYRRTDNKPHGYEENLTKFKDERDAVQKKTFTKWVNKHLKKANRQIMDLFEDLRDGHNLISLLEVLTGEQLPRERGQMRFHMLHNIDTALHFLHCKKIKLVNIRSEDIVDGNPKLTLGLIWTIILHFQISDIVVGQEPNVSAKDYLLRWAKRTTKKYPGVHIQDFSKSWRDGLAFSAIIHRNRPDLIDWRTAKNQRARERMETAFHVVEKEYGVTRLLDPEDVDTHEPDEKSLITYISSLHEVFPEPPTIHPLFDSIAQQKVQEYRELASSLHIWIREKYSLMQDRSFPGTLIEMKKLASESSRFRSDELPPRQRDRNYLSQMYRDLEKYFKVIGEIDVEPELRIDNIDRNWQKLMVAYQERDRHIIDEIKRLEKLQRLAEKIHREIKETDAALDDIEHNIENESRRIERLHPLEAKKVADQLDQDLAITEQNIQALKSEVNILRNGRYSQAGDLDKKVNKLHEKWVNIRRLLHNKMLQPLANLSFPIEERTITKHVRTVQETRNVDTNPHFVTLQEHIEWCKKKLKQLKKADYGTDLTSIQTERDLHQKDHRLIDQFHSKVEACVKARSYFTGEELSLYNQHLGQLQKIYSELLSFSTNRMNDLETLLDFVQSATKELQWLNEKEEEEITRDWSDTKMNVNSIENHFELLMSEFEKREIQLSAVQERGEILVLQNHPGSKAIEAYMASMQAQWAWLLQLTHCLEIHLQNTRQYQIFFQDITTAEKWLKEKDEIMNTEFSQGDFSLDIGERLLQGMQALRDELNTFGDQVQGLTAKAQEIVPLKQRRQPILRPLTVTTICNYKQNNFSIEKTKECTLLDNSGRIKWRVHNEKGIECQVPGVCFVIPPPDKEALDAADRLRRQYDRSISLWQKKQLRMRQNMIFATIKVVKGWDLPQFIAIGAEQRNAIRKALNEDADKLMAEGDPSDPQLRRLRREMDEVNRLFDEFEKRARAEEDSKTQTRVFNNHIASLQISLDEFERIINQRVLAPLPRDVDTLQHMVLEHKEFESRLQNFEPEIEQCKSTFRSITLKTPQHKKDLEKVLDKWKYIWNTSNLYIERLKCIEIVLVGMDDAIQVISEFENKLALFRELPSTVKGLETVHDDLLKLQSAVGQQQIAMDQLNDDFDNTRRLTEKSRPNIRGPHADIETLDKDITKLNSRWNNVCAQLADRLRGCEQAYNVLKNYKTAKGNEDAWLDEQYGKLEHFQPLKDRAKDNLEATRNLLNSVVERAPIIEQVNVSGGRFIREGKIWSKGLQKFRELLLEDQPSLDTMEVFQDKIKTPSGADIVAQELDEFNGKYQYLIDFLYGRLQEIASKCPGDIVTLRLVEQMRPQPFRTFRSEFHMSSASELTSTYTTTTHYSPQFLKTTTTENGNIETSTTRDEIDRISNGRNDKHTTKTQIIQESVNLSNTNIKHNVNDNILFDCISQAKGIVNPHTGEIMTVREAIISRLLDVRTGKLVISNGNHITLNEAVEKGLLDPAIASKLLSPCGILDDNKEITLLEAIQRQIYKAEHGFLDTPEKRTQVNSITINQAIEDGRIDVNDGTFTVETGEIIDLKEAYSRGYLFQKTEIKLQTGSVALFDAVNQGLVDDKTGWIVDRNTGNKYQIDAALKTNVLDGEIKEIVDPIADNKITILQAIDMGIINPKLGKYVLNHEKISFLEAKRRQLIVKPKTLSELVDDNLLDESGKILSPLHRTKLTILEAMSKGMLDIDQIHCILDFRTNEFLTLNQALREGIILPDGIFKNSVTGESITIKEAVYRGYIITVVKKSIFDVDGFQTPEQSDHISFNMANNKGLISKKNGGSLLINIKTGKQLPFSEGVSTDIIKKEVYDMLIRKIGIFEDGCELTVLEAVFRGYIDPKNGNLIDPIQGNVVYLNEAIANHLITPEGAAILNGLLNLTVSTKITHRVVHRYVTVTKKNVEQKQITYTEALRQGLIDNGNQMFYDHSSNESIPIVQAVSEGLLLPDSECSEKTLFNIKPKQPTIERQDSSTSKKGDILSKQISELPSEGWSLFDAIEKNHFDPISGMFVIPGTDRLASFEECIQMKIIDPNSALVIDPNSNEKITLTRSLGKKILDSTGRYNSKNTILNMKDAINSGYIILQRTITSSNLNPPNRAVISENSKISSSIDTSTSSSDVTPMKTIQKHIMDAKEKIEPTPVVESLYNLDKNIPKSKFLSQETIKFAEDEEISEADKTRLRITNQPTYQVTIGRAKSLSPDKEAKQVVLQKLRRKIVTPEDAVQEGIIDQHTADILKEEIFKSPDGEKLTLQEVILSNKIDSNDGRIIDPQRGDVLTINEAISRGLLDPDGSNELLFPLNRSLSIPELLKQGLIDPNKQKIIHPETGSYLSISEGIICDIVDPLSKLVEKHEKITLEKALENGILNEDKFSVKTNNGECDIEKAVKDKIFETFDGPVHIPPAGMTFPVALKLGLIDTENKTVSHPLSKEIIPLKNAIQDNFIMVLPFPINSDFITMEDALDKKLINEKEQTFKNPKTGEIIPISVAVESGLLVLKEPLSSDLYFMDSQPITTITETNNTIHRITTRTIELKSGYNLLNADEIQNTETLEVMSIEEAKIKGIVLNEKEVENTTILRDNVLTFSDALNRGLIDLNSGSFKNPQTGEEMPIEKAVEQGIVSVSDEDSRYVLADASTTTTSITKLSNVTVNVENIIKKETTEGAFEIIEEYPENTEFVKSNIQEQLNKKPSELQINEATIDLADKSTKNYLLISRKLTPHVLSELGYYDLRARQFTDLNGAHVTFETLIYDLDLFNPERILIKDLTIKPEQYISLDNALKRPLIDKNTGHMVDSKTGKRVPFFEAVKLRWIIDVNDKPKAKYQLKTLDEIVMTEFFNPKTVEVTIPDTGEIIPLNKAITSNFIDPKSVTIVDKKNMKMIPYYEAVDKSIVDPRRGFVIDTSTQKILKFPEAFVEGFVSTLPRPLSLQAVILKGMYDENSGKFFDKLTKQWLPINEAVKRQIIDDKISEVKNFESDNFVSLEEALKMNLLIDGKLKINNNELIPLNEGLQLNLIQTKPVVFSLLQIILQNYYLPQNGVILNPITGDEVTLKNAIENKLIDPATTRIKDDRSKRIIELKEAFNSNLLDPLKGVLKYPLLTLDQAYLKGYILSTVLPWSLQETLAQKVYDPKTGQFFVNDEKITLIKAIEGGVVNPDVLTMKDPRSGDIITLKDAIMLRLIDPIEGQAIDPVTNFKSNLYEAQDRGMIVPYNSQITLPEAVFKGFYDPATGKFIHPKSKERLKAESAFNRGYVDTSSTLLTIDEELVTFDQAIVDGYIDTNDGVVISSRNEFVDFNEAFQRGLLVEVLTPIPLSGAISKGIFDETTSLFLDPRTGNYLTLIEAIEINLIDVEFITVKDTRIGVGRKLQFIDAVHKNYIDGNTGLVKDYSKGEIEYTLPKAFEMGILVDNKAAASLQSAAVDKNKERKSFETSMELCTLEEAINLELLDPNIAVTKNQTGSFENVNEAINDGILDKKKLVTFEPSSGVIKSRVLTYEGKVMIFLSEPLEFRYAIESGNLDINSGLFTDPQSKQAMCLKDSISLGYIDPDSAVIKDTNKKKLLKLPEGFRKGIIDSEKGNILDTSSSKLHSLSVAIDKGLLMTPGRGFTLVEAIIFSLYNPTTGGFTDPFITVPIINRKRITLSDAISNNLIDPTGTVVRDCGNETIISLSSAINSNLVDAQEGRIHDHVENKKLDFVKALEKGLILPAEKRQAVEEKYKLCDETLSKLLHWIGDMEEKIAGQDIIHEFEDDLRNQINMMKQIKNELDQHHGQVTNCGDQIRQLVLTAGDVLSKSEITTLEKNGRNLKNRYDKAVDRSNALLKCMLISSDELSKLKSELKVFSDWLGKARRVLEDKENSLSDLKHLYSSADTTKEFISDVISHQADLRFITMSAQKFVDEGKEYLKLLNNFRTSLPSRLPHIEPLSSQESPIHSEISFVTQQYKDLLNRANNLSNRLSGVGGRQREYNDALEKAELWLKDVEPRTLKILNQPIGGDPRAIEDQLVHAKTMNNEFVANKRLIDNAKMSTKNLLASIESQISPSEIKNLEQPVIQLEQKYNQLSSAITDRCQDLETALIQSQGVQDALDSIMNWLNSIENQFKNMQKPASLIKERLDDQIREHRVIQSDIDNHIASVDSVYLSASELVHSTSNSHVAKKIESKLNDVKVRFEKLFDRSQKRGEHLAEVDQELTLFNNQVSKFNIWYKGIIEIIESRDLSKFEDKKLQELNENVEKKHPLFEEIIQNGKNLLGKRDITDTSNVRDNIKSLETQWRDLLNLLDEKQRLSKQRSEQQVAYDKLREQVNDWLNKMENKVSHLDGIAIDLEILKKQKEELKPISKEHKDYAPTIDKIYDVGLAYENLIRGDRPDSPTKRKSQPYISTKRTFISDARSPSPTKALSPLSTGSSGFSSRRSSQDGFHLEELSPIQQQLVEINNRYSLLGVKITDRQSEIDSILEEVKKYLENLKILSSFLDKVQRQLPKDTVPNSKDEADKLNKQIKQVLEEMYEKQSLLDSTKGQITDLLRRKPKAIGFDNLNDELEDVVSHWKGLSDHLKNKIKFLEDMREFHDTHDSLNSWLGAKQRMLTVLGPISSDSRMVQSQVQQVQVLREEFRSQQPQLQHLIHVGDSVLAYLDVRSPDGQKINNKITTIQQKWADLLGKLEERADSLGAAVDTSREFDAQLIRLKDALQSISDSLDELSLDKDPEEQLRKVENLERQLEGQRPLLTDLEAAGAHLCDVLSDPASRADIQAKLASVGRQFNALQKKLDYKKAELEGSLKDGRQFEENCSKTVGWLSEELGSLSERLLISADRVILDQQLAHHEPIYRVVLSREHEIIMLLNKGRDMLARSFKTDTRTLQRELDKIQQYWDKLRKEAVDRQTRLQTCKEHCRKYYCALKNFLPWLRSAEDKLDSLRPTSFLRKHIEKQLKELQAFRNEVWKSSGEYENTKALGDTFMTACDIDKDIVKNEILSLQERWDKLNNDLIKRTQALEDQSRKLIDMNENLREFQHGLERCEDKLASHDALGGAAKDPKLLDRIKALRDESYKLKKPLQAVRKQVDDLVHEASENGIDALHLKDDVDRLSDRLNELQAKLDDRCSELHSAATAVAQFNDQVKKLTLNLSGLETKLDNMKPAGRDLKTVKNQLDEISMFIKEIKKTSNEVDDAIHSGEVLVDNGFDTAQTMEQIEVLKKQLGKLDDRSRIREEDLRNVQKKLEEFYSAYSTILKNCSDAFDQLQKLKAVGSEVDNIRAQQQDFRKFQNKVIEPLGKDVDFWNKFGQNLIQSAAAGVNTAILEKDLEKMNEQWNSLKEKINDKERRLDVALLQSGKFQEALDGLDKWLTDTEDLVANQKPPSADYKVVKAQLQEQKFLKKMLLDRQPSMSSLFSMGNDIAKEADPAERKSIEKQLKNLMERFDGLTQGAQQRTLDLEQTMRVAKEFQDKLTPLQEWLDRSEKKIKDMEIIPTDEEKIQQTIREHDILHNDILNKKPDFRELTDIASNLMSLVGEDEASGLADKLQEVTERYGHLVESSENIGELLSASRQGLRHLVLTYQDLAAWMDSLEHRLGRYKVLAVHKDRLLEQMDDITSLTEELTSRQQDVDGTVDAGVELMRHISSDEALQLKDKLDSLQRRYNDLTSRGAELLKNAQEMLPLVQKFHDNHNRLVEWMQGAEIILQSAEPNEDEIARLEYDLQELRPILEHINILGPQLCQASPGEGAATIEALVTRDNRRFDAIAEQIQRRAERIHLSKQRALEVNTDIDELLEWFREIEGQIKDAEKPSAEPDLIRVQLKEHKALNDDISSQKSRVRDVLSTAKKVLRETPPNEDTSLIREKMEDLRETMDIVSALSTDRLGILEQALPLAEHFHDTHNVLINWLSDMEDQVSMLSMPALRPDLIAQQQDRNEMFIQSINEHKPLVDKLNKTGEALIRLCNDDDGSKVQELLDSDNDRYASLKLELRQRQQALEEALQESSQFTDKLEGMLRALTNTADQVNNLEPISAHPPKINDQIEDNDALMGDLDKRKEAYAAVQRAADDVINKAGNRSDPAIKEIKRKLDKLNKLWDDVQKATNNRGNSLEQTLDTAQKFWKELHAIMSTLKDLETSLISQEPPAVEPKAIQEQQVALQEIRQEIDQTKPEVDQVRSSGQKLMKLCGEPDKPEVKKHIEDLDHAWDNITSLYAKREENLIDAMEKAMEFHETLQNLLEFLEKAENKFAKMGPLGADIDAVKKQTDQLKLFKAEVDPHMVKVEALNRSLIRQAQELTERTSADQASAIKEPLSAVNKRWDDLLRSIVERQRQLENALLRLGQFQHALNELLIWIQKTDKTLDELKPVAGDAQILEIELAKLKVLINDIQAHQTSIDTLNDAGRLIIESGEDEASKTQEKLNILNSEWRALMRKAADRQRELEDALIEAQRFNAEIQDLLAWLGDVDSIITASKPVGGLPETASEQLERFMEIYNEIEDNRPKIETFLAQGQEYLKKGDNKPSNLQHNLRTLKQRWDSVIARANDKKIKLEIALKEATEFHEALQAFVDWLTNAEKILTNLKPVSRVLETIQQQIEEHKVFQKDVGAHREIMLQLDKKGTHLKYFSQKQDVILIKNLLISVQHRWERVASKSAERTRSLDLGYKEAKEFHDSWSGLMTWLEDTENSLDKLLSAAIGNDPEQIKLKLSKHQECQRALSGKQSTYDTVMKTGKSLKDKAPKSDEPILTQMLVELKNKWNNLCGKSVDRQRKLEEALLYSGQFKDALAALLQWLKKVEKELSVDSPVCGDLDTVNHLVEQHRQFEKELERRNGQMESVMRTGQELERKAYKDDAAQIRGQLNELNNLWDNVSELTHLKSDRLKDALKEAEKLHMSVNMLLDWLSEAEMKLRFAGSTPEDEASAYEQLRTLDNFRAQLAEKEIEKNRTLELAHTVLAKAHPDSINVIKNWIKVIQARWEEVSQWALQRHQKLTSHMQSLKDLDETLEELIQWLLGLENTLVSLKREELPMDIPTTEKLINDHKEFMENTQRRQVEVDRICKAKQIKPGQGSKDVKKFGKGKTSIRGSQYDIRELDSHNTLGHKQSRSSPGRELSPDPQYPHYGPRFTPNASEPEFRSPRVKFLYDKWRHVWMLSWERQRELYEHLAYLKEKEKADNFSWDDWRKRFLKFMNYKKSRLTDLFRKMDKDNNELIPRDDFIDGILKTKFDSSRLEMKHVADMFDLDNRGFIDWKKFIAALRPDWEEKAPNDSQKIHDEVKRLVMLCTCRQKFRVFQVGEGKYRFGESQKLRLVRILRSTVMVRVGGGWVALDEFLLKNDPCRAKGRTNIELREQFILADGVSQTMTAFKPKTSAASPASGSSTSSLRTPQGPITKVRERSARSVPMGSLPRTSKSSLSAGTPDSLSDNESSVFRTPRRPSYRPSLTPGGSRSNSRPASRPGSRPGSKPPSRHGSNLSLDSTGLDDSVPSRIPRKTPVSTKSSTLRRNVNGASSGSRTPSGLSSPTSQVMKSSGIPRASSIPMLTAISPRSCIPVLMKSGDTEPESPSTSSSCSVSFSSGTKSSTTSNKSSISKIPVKDWTKPRTVTVGNPPTLRTASRTRTPSGSNTPVPVGTTTAVSKLLRRSSGASDTQTGQAKKTSKEPFRL